MMKRVRENLDLFRTCAYSFLAICAIDGMWDLTNFFERISSPLASPSSLPLIYAVPISSTALLMIAIWKSRFLSLRVVGPTGELHPQNRF
jgi:hypothetical protein